MKLTYKTPYGEVEFPIHPQNVGISCSGGVDSTLVLYLLLLNGVIPRIFFLEKANSKLEALISCVQFLERKFNLKLEIEVVPRKCDHHFLRPDIMNLTQKVDILYTGVTSNPPHDFKQSQVPDRPLKNNTSNIITPFLPFDKRSTVYLYRYFALQELFDLTYSCTEKATPCGYCFACEEKKWAQDEVGSLC